MSPLLTYNVEINYYSSKDELSYEDYLPLIPVSKKNYGRYLPTEIFQILTTKLPSRRKIKRNLLCSKNTLCQYSLLVKQIKEVHQLQKSRTVIVYQFTAITPIFIPDKIFLFMAALFLKLQN